MQPAQQPDSTTSNAPQKPQHFWLVMLLLAGLIAAGPLYDNHLQQSNIAANVSLSLPATTGSWQLDAPEIDWQPRFANPSAEHHSVYRTPDGWVGLYIAYYQNQSFKRKLVTSTNVLATSNDPRWQIIPLSSTSAAFNGAEQRVREVELLDKLNSAEHRYIVWQWYWINGHLTSSDIEAKWLTAWAMLTGHGDDSAVVIIYAPKAGASNAMHAFTNELGTEMLRGLAEANQK